MVCVWGGDLVGDLVQSGAGRAREPESQGSSHLRFSPLFLLPSSHHTSLSCWCCLLLDLLRLLACESQAEPHHSSSSPLPRPQPLNGQQPYPQPLTSTHANTIPIPIQTSRHHPHANAKAKANRWISRSDQILDFNVPNFVGTLDVLQTISIAYRPQTRPSSRSAVSPTNIILTLNGRPTHQPSEIRTIHSTRQNTKLIEGSKRCLQRFAQPLRAASTTQQGRKIHRRGAPAPVHKLFCSNFSAKSHRIRY